LWGTFASQFERTDTPALSNWRVWMLNFSGVALALYVFMADTIAASHHGLDAIRNMLPEQFNWPVFCVALALMSAPVLRISWHFLMQTRTKPESHALVKEFRCARDPQN